MDQCPVCRNDSAKVIGLHDIDASQVSCATCGDFKCTMEAIEDLDLRCRSDSRLRFHVAGMLRALTLGRRFNNAPIPLLVTSRRHVPNAQSALGLDDVLSKFPLPVQDRVDVLLRNLVAISAYPGASLKLTRQDYSLGYAEGEDAFLFLLQQLQDDLLVSVPEVETMWDVPVVVTPKGWNRFAEIERGKLASNPLQGFVAMYMAQARRGEWEPGLREGVERAGYEPLVIDQVEYVGSISDRIIAEIRKSRFVVADFTEQRQNVYFEAGFAEGLGIPVFFTCHADHINDLHFDKRQENTIPWTSFEELAERLHRRIEAVIGRPPERPTASHV